MATRDLRPNNPPEPGSNRWKKNNGAHMRRGRRISPVYRFYRFYRLYHLGPAEETRFLSGVGFPVRCVVHRVCER